MDSRGAESVVVRGAVGDRRVVRRGTGSFGGSYLCQAQGSRKVP